MNQVRLGLIIVLSILMPAMLIAAEHGGHKKMAGPGCHYCGMNLEKFSHSAIDITYDDESKTGLCSVHCLAIDLALNIDKAPVTLTVGDFNTKQKIDAHAAYWVLDEKNPGVMTGRAKWAFAQKTDAETFISKNGGTLISFEDAVEAAYMDMHKDTQMIRKKRKMRKSGKMMGHQM